MTIKSKAAEKADNTKIRDFARGKGQYNFVKDVMGWEKCSMEEAIAMCLGNTDPKRTEYTLGYKLADPVWSLGVYSQPGHHARAKAAREFRKQLTPEEDELFVTECLGKTARQIKKEFKSEMKAKKKEAKAKGKDVDLQGLDGDDDGSEEA